MKSGLNHPLRVSCDGISDQKELDQKRKQIHATSLSGFINFKSELDFDKVISRRQKANMAKALQSQSQNKAKQMLSQHKNDLDWKEKLEQNVKHETRKENQQISERNDVNKKNQEQLLAQMREARQKQMHLSMEDQRVEIDYLYGPRALRKDNDIMGISTMRKQWQKMNQNNLLKQAEYNDKLREKELDDNYNDDQHFLKQIGCQTMRGKHTKRLRTNTMPGKPRDTHATYMNYLYTDKIIKNDVTLAAQLALKRGKEIQEQRSQKERETNDREDRDVADRQL